MTRRVAGVWLAVVLAALVGGIVAGSASVPAPQADAAGGKRERVRLQLKWVTQAQFAGYYIAQSLGFYAEEGLDVEIIPGGPGLEPEQVVAAGNAEFGIDWVPSLLAERERGLDLVNIAQVYQRSGTSEVTWKDSGISTIAGLRGKRVAVWCCGNQYELYAALRKEGIDPDNPADVQIVDQPFDMDLLLNRQVDAAAATTYNELAQVLETVNPATGRLYTLDDLNVISMEDAGVGMLQDGIFTTAAWLRTPGNEQIAERFLRASFRGWIYCRENPEACVQEVLRHGPTLGAGHQRWMMTEVNALIWPSPDGIGQMNRAAYDRTATIARQYDVITRPPDAGAYRTDIARAALATLQGDTRGLTWRKPPVQVTPGGR